MAQYAVLIYDVDSAHSPGATADTSPEVATCDEHAQALVATAVMTAAWAFTPRAMATSVRTDGITHPRPLPRQPGGGGRDLHPRGARP